MCFSATASFAAASVLGTAGVFTLREARAKAQLPFAAIPLFFAVQQAAEGVVWLSFDRPALHAISAFVFVMFSHVFWPVFLPISVRLIETDARRKKLLDILILLGVAVATTLLFSVLQGPVSADIVGRCIDYKTTLPDVPFGWYAYVLATCASCLISSHRLVKILGVAALASLLITLWSYRTAAYSVWCFFAALLSLIIYVHFRQMKRKTAST